MDKPIRRIDLVRWGIIVLFAIAGLALFVSTVPIMVIFCIILGWVVAWFITLALFGLPCNNTR